MKRALPYIFSAAMAVAITATPLTAARVGDSAPDFTAAGSNGQTYKLADFRGKFVVLEWHNQDAPILSSTIRAATWRNCRKIGLRRAWCGLQ